MAFFPKAFRVADGGVQLQERGEKRRILIGIAALVLSASAPKAEEWPGILEAKDIAEQGFIYGLPIVMNYAVMYAYAVDRDSGQFKAPFNEIKNETRVFTYKDTAIVTPN